MIDIADLRMHFTSTHGLPGRRHTRTLRAVDGVELSLVKGEAVGLVGESGCGKSTLARCVTGLHAPTSGQLRFEGREVGVRRDTEMRRKIQMVFQDPYASLNPRMTIGQVLSELLRVHRIVPDDAVDERCRELLELVGLGERARHSRPRQLSGGQRQRASIARALALKPSLLVADEPVSALDVSMQATVLNLLARLRRELDLALLLITHDMAVVRHVCDRVAVMYLGRIVEVAETEELFSRPRHPYTRRLIASVPRLTPGRRGTAPALAGDPPSPLHLPSGCRFRSRCDFAEADCAQTEPQLESGPGASHGHLTACLHADHVAEVPTV